MEDDDEGLVHALVRRDRRAAAVLFDRYGGYVQRVIARMIGYSELERTDLLHDVFLRALERIDELRNPKALKSWMVGIAMLVTKEWLGRRRRAGVPVGPEQADHREAASVSPESAEAVRSLYGLLDCLSDADRIMVVLRLVEGMNVSEIARAADLSISTARRRVLRAEERFHKLLPRFPALFERIKKEN
jgi:RNA polymerase sigma-70 factor, ECF subfamily